MHFKGNKRQQVLVERNEKLKQENSQLKKQIMQLQRENNALRNTMLTNAEEQARVLKQLRSLRAQYSQLVYDTKQKQKQYAEDMQKLLAKVKKGKGVPTKTRLDTLKR